MSETILGESRFSNLYSKAYYAKNSIDRRNCYFDPELAVEDYKDFLTEKLKNPTRADAAMQKVISKHNINYPVQAQEHKAMLEKAPEIEVLIQSINNKICNDYPNSQKLRNLLNLKKRINLDYVTPKMNILSKFILNLKSML